MFFQSKLRLFIDDRELLMDKKSTLRLLEQVSAGEISPKAALIKLKSEPFEDMGFAKPDHHRALRQGIAEVIYGEGKTPEQIAAIASSLLGQGQKNILITRLGESQARSVAEKIQLEYDKTSRMGIIGALPEPDTKGYIVVATGGTSDIPVAEEAAITAEALGNRVVRMYDVGVSGLHRLMAQLDTLMNANVVIAIAGMEGALASVIGGLVDCPVIGVPTSIGYGSSMGGLSALLCMLNSCASGVCAVNIDNGFGGGYLASIINHMGENK